MSNATGARPDAPQKPPSPETEVEYTRSESAHPESDRSISRVISIVLARAHRLRFFGVAIAGFELAL